MLDALDQISGADPAKARPVPLRGDLTLWARPANSWLVQEANALADDCLDDIRKGKIIAADFGYETNDDFTFNEGISCQDSPSNQNLVKIAPKFLPRGVNIEN